MSIAFFLALLSSISAQSTSPNLQTICIKNNEAFAGYELLDVEDKQVFVLAEHWHNIGKVPEATLKLLKYLHVEANVRILAIEQGKSAAYLVNKYLDSGDPKVLKQITRNTMFWGQENAQFFKQLHAFNQLLDPKDRIIVKSIDIEYKMESAILMLNESLPEETIPEDLMPTLGLFQRMFEETRSHREQYDGIAVMYYYDRELVTELVKLTKADLSERPTVYRDYLNTNFETVATLIKEMDAGLTFDYVNPNTNYKFRDALIYERFNELISQYPETGIVCVIGSRHATKKSSLHKLNSQATSPAKDKVLNIRMTALYHNSFHAADLRRINFAFPNQLKAQEATMIKHDPDDPSLRTKKYYDYTLFINDDSSLTPFPNILRESFSFN